MLVSNAEACVCKAAECHFTRVLFPALDLHEPNLCYVSLMQQQRGAGRRARALEKESGSQKKGIGSVNSPLPFDCFGVSHSLDTPLEFSTHLEQLNTPHSCAHVEQVAAVGLHVGLNQQRKCQTGTGCELSLEAACADCGVNLFRDTGRYC